MLVFVFRVVRVRLSVRMIGKRRVAPADPRYEEKMDIGVLREGVCKNEKAKEPHREAISPN